MLTDNIYKGFMRSVGMPNSEKLLQALQQCSLEPALEELEKCAALIRNRNMGGGR